MKITFATTEKDIDFEKSIELVGVPTDVNISVSVNNTKYYGMGVVGQNYVGLTSSESSSRVNICDAAYELMSDGSTG